MAEYIDRDALLAEAKRISGPMTGDGWDNWGVYALINRQPAVDVVERKKGMWLYWWDEPDYDTYECSACGTSFNIQDGNPLEHNYKFCPNCGANMRGET